ncbi:MAG: hypothetical protein BZ137_08435 [Methanosphaera sp. rholeuAM130]|nr:MAG: hypothetical protein BZ137_08435 [Methanosphaera sp. rholeuAM130]
MKKLFTNLKNIIENVQQFPLEFFWEDFLITIFIIIKYDLILSLIYSMKIYAIHVAKIIVACPLVMGMWQQVPEIPMMRNITST